MVGASVGQNSKPQVKAKVYTLDGQPLNGEAEIVEGTIRVFSHPVKVLIDPGATHSFVSMHFIKHIPKISVSTPYQLIVCTLMGVSRVTEEKYHNCDIYIRSEVLPRDLITLSFEGYDVILGMDWLYKHYAQVDCRKKMVKFTCPDMPILEFQRDKTKKKNHLISDIKARKFIKRGCQGYFGILAQQNRRRRTNGDYPSGEGIIEYFSS